MALPLLSADAEPITIKEREGRIAKAQRLLIENKMEALVLDCGTSMQYFTGITGGPANVRW